MASRKTIKHQIIVVNRLKVTGDVIQSPVIMPSGPVAEDAEAIAEIIHWQDEKSDRELARSVLRPVRNNTLSHHLVLSQQLPSAIRSEELKRFFNLRFRLRAGAYGLGQHYIDKFAAFAIRLGSLATLVKLKPSFAQRIAEELFIMASEAAVDGSDPSLIVTAMHQLAIARSNQGDRARAARTYEEIDRYHSVGAIAPTHLAGLFCDRGICLVRLGRLDEGASHLNHAVEMAHEASDPVRLGCVRMFQSVLSIRTNGLDQSIQRLDEASALFAGQNTPLYDAMALKFRAIALLQAGEANDSQRVLQKSMEMARAGGFTHQVSSINRIQEVFERDKVLALAF